MTRNKRILLGTLFVLCLAVCGLVVGTWIGGRFFVAPGSGLAGPVIALGYGVGGALVAAIVATIMAIYLPPKLLLGAALPVTAVGVVLLLVIGNLFMRSRAETAAFMEEAYDDLNRFTLTLEHTSGAPEAPFARMEIDWSARSYKATTSEDPPRICTAALSGPEAVAILGALREVEGVLLRDEFPCAGTLGQVERTMAFRIVEARPPNTEADLAITASCASAFPALTAPFVVAAEILEDGDHTRECR